LASRRLSASHATRQISGFFSIEVRASLRTWRRGCEQPAAHLGRTARKSWGFALARLVQIGSGSTEEVEKPMSLTAPSHVSSHSRRGTPIATSSAEAARTDRGSPAPSKLAVESHPETPEPHWQASIESATD
jgi:hypothetical protein